MKVREIMSREVRTVTPQTTLGEAALLMRQADIGALLVNEGERLTGVVTDRDLAVRGLADGLGADRPVREVMSGELRYCFEDEEVDHVAKNMAQLEKRRLPVMDRNKRLVGIVSLANRDLQRRQAQRQPLARRGPRALSRTSRNDGWWRSAAAAPGSGERYTGDGQRASPPRRRRWSRRATRPGRSPSLSVNERG